MSPRLTALLCLALGGCGAPRRHPRLEMEPAELARLLVAQAAERGISAEVRHEGPGLALRLTAPSEHALAWSLDGRWLAAAEPASLTLVPVDGGAPTRVPIEPPAARTPALHWLADGRLWVDCGPRRVLAWAPGAESLTAGPALDDPLAAVRPDGAQALVWRGQTPVVVTLKEGEWTSGAIGVWRHGRAPAAFGPDGLYLAAAQELKVFDPETRKVSARHPWIHAVAAGTPLPPEATHLVITDRWIHVLAGPLLMRWTSPGYTGAGGPLPKPYDVRAAAFGGERAWLIDAAEGLVALDPAGGAPTTAPAVRAVAVDRAGERIAVIRGDGLWVQAEAGRAPERRAPAARRTTEAVAVGDRDGATWVMGVRPRDDLRLPVLAGIGAPAPSGLERGGAYTEVRTRAGVVLEGDRALAGAEAFVRLGPYAFGFGGDQLTPSRQHLFVPALQVGVDVRLDGDEAMPAARLALPLVYRTQRGARWDEVAYAAGLPFTLTLEPGVRLPDTGLELGVSAGTEEWGGLFARVGYALDDDAPYVQLGAELGRTPTAVVFGAALLAALVYGLASYSDSFCYRCSGPHAQD